MLASASAASDQIASATAELRQAHDTTSTQSKEMAKIAQLKMSVKILEDNFAFYETSEEDLKVEPAKSTAESTRLEKLLYGTRAQVVDLPEKLAAKDAVIMYRVQDLCVTLGPSAKDLVEKFRAGLNNLQWHHYQFFQRSCMEDGGDPQKAKTSVIQRVTPRLSSYRYC